MTSGTSTRVVEYRLKTIVDQSSLAAVGKLADVVKKSELEATKIHKAEAQKRAENERIAVGEIKAIHERNHNELRTLNMQMTSLLKIEEEKRTRAVEEEARKQEAAKKAAAASALKSAEQAVERNAEILKRSSREMNDGFLKAGEGLVTVTRGFAELGILNKENSEDMLRALIGIQAVVDLAKGSIDIYRGLSATVDAYTTSVKAAAAAEGLLATARARTAATGGAAAAGGLGSAGTAVSSGSALTGVLGTLSAAIFSLPGAIALAITGTAAAGAMAFNVGGARDRAARAIPESWVDPNSFWGTRLGELSALSEFSGSIGMYSPSQLIYGDLATEQRSALASQGRVEQMSADRQGRLAFANQQNSLADMGAAFDSKMQQFRLNSLLGRAGLTADDIQEELPQALDRLREASQRVATAEAGPNSFTKVDDIRRAREAELAAAREVNTLRQRALSLSQQESATRLAAAKAETGELKQQKELREREKQDAENRYRSAKERFGDMSETERRQLIEAKKKADKGLPLSVAERQALRGIGTENAAEAASQASLADAARFGFDKYFGQSETNLIQDRDTKIAQLQAQIDAKVKYEVKLETDKEAVAAAVVAAINDQNESIAEMVQRLMREEYHRSRTGLNNRSPVSGITSGN